MRSVALVEEAGRRAVVAGCGAEPQHREVVNLPLRLQICHPPITVHPSTSVPDRSEVCGHLSSSSREVSHPAGSNMNTDNHKRCCHYQWILKLANVPVLDSSWINNAFGAVRVCSGKCAIDPRVDGIGSIDFRKLHP